MAAKKMSKKTIILIVIVSVLAAFLGGVLVGGIGGLLYAWVINPLEFVDALPSQLRGDYQAIYVNLVIDSYTINHDLDLAAAYLDSWETPEIISLLSEQLDNAVTKEDFDKAELIRNLLLLYRDSGQND